ncbi:carboxypeptidase regulatory-like domain-containing protein [Rohdeia mirabilis]
MRPAVVLPFVLVAVIALLAVLFTGDSEPALGPNKVASDGLEQVSDEDEPDLGPVSLVGDDTTPSGAESAASTERRTVQPEVAEAISADNSSNIVVTVRDEAGNLLPKARISLKKRPPGSELAPFLGQLQNGNAGLGLNDEDFVGVTRESGTFTFEDLAPSPFYAITVRHDDFAEQELRNVAVTAGRTQTVTVTLQEGLLVHGYIRDEGGRSVEGAQIILMPIAALNLPTATQIEMGKSTKSNADGYYSIANVDLALTNTISAYKKGFGRASRVDLRQDGADTTVEADFRLLPGLSIRGRVVGPAGEPIEGARVDAYGFVSIQASRGSATSKSDGTFELIDLVDGPYQIRAYVAGWSEVREPRVDAGEQNLLLELQPLCEVTGRVVVGATNGPVANYTLSVRRVTPGSQVMSAPFMPKKIENAQNGEFTMSGIPEGVYLLQAECEGFAASQSSTFEARLGQVVNGIEIRMTTGGGLTGRVVDALTGDPIAGARVKTQDSGFMDNPLTQLFGSVLSRRTTARTAVTDEAGTFTMEQLMPGEYQLHIQHPGYTAAIVSDLEVPESEEPLDYGDFALEVGGSITGFVRDENGELMNGATIGMSSMDKPGITFQGSTDEEGRYTIDHIASGRYQIHAQRAAQTGGNPFMALLDVQRSQREIYIENGVEQVFDLSLAE